MRALSILPEVRIHLDGQALGFRERDTLASVRVQQRLSLPAQVELTFFDPPDDLGLAPRLTPGATIELAVSQAEPLFRGEITAVQYAYEADQGLAIRVRGYDLLHRLRKRQHPRTFTDITLAHLAEEVTRPLGISVHNGVPDLRWSQITQHGQTDLQLLQELFGEAGCHFNLSDGTLRLLTLAGDGDPIDLRVGRDLWEVRLELNSDQTAERVVATGWDPRDFSASRAEVTGARSGRQIEASVTAAETGGDDRRLLPEHRGHTRDHVTALAQSDLDRRALADAQLWGTAAGDSRFRPGARIRIEGVARPFEGVYVLTAVTHLLDERGYSSALSTEPPIDRRSSHPVRMLPGTVTDVADPDQLGRVRVEFDVLDRVSTEWMPVLLPAAGRDHGLTALPDVDDRVLVALPHGDAARGVVLGAVFGREAPSDDGVAGGRVKRYLFHTRGGHRLTFDDERDRLRLEDASGSYIEMSPGEVQFHANGDLTIEAPGRRVTIVANTVDFERG